MNFLGLSSIVAGFISIVFYVIGSSYVKPMDETIVPEQSIEATQNH